MMSDCRIATLIHGSRAVSVRVRVCPFYESDGQGRTPSLLIASAFSPWPSAPNLDLGARPSGAIGFAVSVSASVSSSSLQVRFDVCKRLGRGGEPWFYLRLDRRGRPDASSGPAGGPMVGVVLRRGLMPSRTDKRDCLPHPRPGSWSHWRRNDPTPLVGWIAALARLHRLHS